MRVQTDGKSFVLGAACFPFRGVKYRAPARPAGPAKDEALPLEHDLAAMAATGYSVVSLPPPPPRAVEILAASGMKCMLDLEDLHLERLESGSRRAGRKFARETAAELRPLVAAMASSGVLIGVIVNAASPPAASRAQRSAEYLAMLLRDIDPCLLAAWRTEAPLEAACPAEFDFLVADCRVQRWDDLPGTLMASHSAVGDRPLVLGRVRLADGPPSPPPDAAWLADQTLRSGAAGLLSPEPARSDESEPEPNVIAASPRTVRDLNVDWPGVSVVISAYNAAATLEECLAHCDRLEYPRLEVIVVNDGSTDATAEIARRHSNARLINIPQSGLSTARNVGWRSASGELVAYLDADAYPSPDWPFYLALAALGGHAGGAGGPNVPPKDEPLSARVVAQSPGGPVPQLLTPSTAAHLPGCNMAFWRALLERLEGFDAVVDGSEDLEFEWRVAEAGLSLAYHPAALVWHRRRPGLRAYARQQRRYGRGQAILERRYPDRFPRGHRLRRAARRLRGLTTERSEAGTRVHYASLPAAGGTIDVLLHQWGIPAACVVCSTTPLGLLRRPLAVPGASAAAVLALIFASDVARAGSGRSSQRSLSFRVRVAAFRLIRPLAFRWGHLEGLFESLPSPTDGAPRRHCP